MSRNEKVINAPPDAVFKVLADAHCYPRWVIGARRIRNVDGDFPTQGSRFYHAVGFGPFELRDHTEVVEVEPGRRLVLRARARPATVAAIALDLEPREEKTNVVMVEEPDQGPMHWLPKPFRDILLGSRNAVSLVRLKRLVEHSVA